MNILRFAIGGIPLPDHIPLSLGSRHPSTAGVVGLEVAIQNERVSRAEIQPGYLHRAAEKLFEVRDYRSLITLADRHDWLSSFSGELVVTLAAERAMGLVPPPRALWLRTVLAECGRIHSHLSYLSHVCPKTSLETLWEIVDDMREAVRVFSGNRIHPMLNRIGGLACDMPSGWGATMMTVLSRVDALAKVLGSALDTHGERFLGLAVAGPDTCMEYGLSGPVARATGLAMDSRPNQGMAYEEVHVETPLYRGGDALDRFRVLAAELSSSSIMVRRCFEGLPGGPVNVRLSRRLKIPEGQYLGESEAPWGVASALLVSRGAQTPWRMALRTPTFANVSALEALLVGSPEKQIADVVASVGYGIGDLDK